MIGDRIGPPIGMSVRIERIRDNCFAWVPIEGAVY